MAIGRAGNRQTGAFLPTEEIPFTQRQVFWLGFVSQTRLPMRGAQWHLRLRSTLQQRGLQRLCTVFPFQRPLETGGACEQRYSIRSP